MKENVCVYVCESLCVRVCTARCVQERMWVCVPLLSHRSSACMCVLVMQIVKVNECVICVIKVEEGNGESCMQHPVSLGSCPNNNPWMVWRSQLPNYPEYIYPKSHVRWTKQIKYIPTSLGGKHTRQSEMVEQKTASSQNPEGLLVL